MPWSNQAKQLMKHLYVEHMAGLECSHCEKYRCIQVINDEDSQMAKIAESFAGDGWQVYPADAPEGAGSLLCDECVEHLENEGTLEGRGRHIDE